MALPTQCCCIVAVRKLFVSLESVEGGGREKFTTAHLHCEATSEKSKFLITECSFERDTSVKERLQVRIPMTVTESDLCVHIVPCEFNGARDS